MPLAKARGIVGFGAPETVRLATANPCHRRPYTLRKFITLNQKSIDRGGFLL